MGGRSAEVSVIHRMVEGAWSALAARDPDDPFIRQADAAGMIDASGGQERAEQGFARSWLAAPTDPDDPRVRGFAEFGLSPSSSLVKEHSDFGLVAEDQLHTLNEWRESLLIPANSAFLDGTLLQTVWALLDPNYGPEVLTPVTLWELTAFIDALVCFDRLYCVSNPDIDVAGFNRLLGAEVLSEISDPKDGVLRRLATSAAVDGVENMTVLAGEVGHDDEFGEEVQAVAKGWQAVLGADLPSYSPFDGSSIDIPFVISGGGGAFTPLLPVQFLAQAQRQRSAAIIDGSAARSGTQGLSETLRVLILATRVPPTPLDSAARPPLDARRRLAANATYRTYVNQAIANALAVPYMPGTLRMPFRRMFVKRAAEVHDELLTVAAADRSFAHQQPSSPLTLPFFTSAVLRQATTLADVWVQMAHVREQSGPFRRKRAELDALLERSQVSPEALQLQAAISDEGLKMADLAGVAQQSASVALGVVAQTSIVPMAGAIKVGIDAARGVGRDDGWTRVWRRLFHRHEYFLAQINSQAIALTNAMPQLQRLWELPRIGGYLNRFGSATQEVGRILRES